MAAPATARSGVTSAGGGTKDRVGENSSGDGKTTAAVDGDEGPADATNDNME